MVEQKAVTQSAAVDVTEEKRKYRKLMARRGLFLAFCVVLLIVLAGVALTIGSADMSFLDAYSAVFARAFPSWFHTEPLWDTVVWTLRLPRILLAIFAGAILAMGGAMTQDTLRNPLATPYTLGVSASASLGAAIGIILGAGFLEGPYMIIGNAFVFSLLPVVVILLARRRGASPEMMILAGVAMAYLFNACIMILQYFAQDDALSRTVFWMMGDLTNAYWWQIPYVLGVFVVALALNVKLAWDVNIMKMGDDTAKSLGVEVDRTRKLVLVTACLSTAVVVSFTGAIGFICLIAPHICRAIIGGEERYLIVSSAFFGSILLLLADIVARRLIAPAILPVGAITAFLGAPVLLYLLFRWKRHR